MGRCSIITVHRRVNASLRGKMGESINNNFVWRSICVFFLNRTMNVNTTIETKQKKKWGQEWSSSLNIDFAVFCDSCGSRGSGEQPANGRSFVVWRGIVRLELEICTTAAVLELICWVITGGIRVVVVSPSNTPTHGLNLVRFHFK